jgi:hypothetical protein
MCPTRQDWVLFLLLCIFAALMLMCGGCRAIHNFGMGPDVVKHHHQVEDQ